ncbi:MAG: hypothetical protein HC802_07405 [Caldilineaceae bacterium]|nr:hypothetical protein [Caldilineaceae bacterium]
MNKHSTSERCANERCANEPVAITVYVAAHCPTCDYAREVARSIREEYPRVQVQLVDVENTTEVIPETVFATPTYLLNGRVWSLGNPSAQKITESLGPLVNG